MCIACSPICGHCRPPRKRAVFCPDCGHYNLYDIEIQYPPIKRQCSACGLDVTSLATPKVVHCKNTGWLCANPCHYHIVNPEDRAPRVCRSNTPPPVRLKTSA